MIRIPLLILLGVILPSSLFALDMSLVSDRATDLGMTVSDYEFAMAIAGTFSGSLLGLFLWKVK